MGLNDIMFWCEEHNAMRNETPLDKICRICKTPLTVENTYMRLETKICKSTQESYLYKHYKHKKCHIIKTASVQSKIEKTDSYLENRREYMRKYQHTDKRQKWLFEYNLKKRRNNG